MEVKPPLEEWGLAFGCVNTRCSFFNEEDYPITRDIPERFYGDWKVVRRKAFGLVDGNCICSRDEAFCTPFEWNTSVLSGCFEKEVAMLLCLLALSLIAIFVELVMRFMLTGIKIPFSEMSFPSPF